MTHHTPGKWEISREGSRWIIQKQGAIGKKAIAYLVGDYVSCAEDARLIAAAPELFAIAEKSLAAFNYLAIRATTETDRQEFKKREDQARAAIAAATGKEG